MHNSMLPRPRALMRALTGYRAAGVLQGRGRPQIQSEFCISRLGLLELQGLRGLELQRSVAGSFRWIQ